MDSNDESEEPEGGWVHLTAANMAHFGETIPAVTFRERRNLRSVVFHSTLLYIHEGAFYGCINLKNVTFPPHLKWIGRRAFMHCAAVTALSIPGSLVEIGNFAFAYSTNLAIVTFPPHLKTTIKGYGFDVFFGCNLLPAGIDAVRHTANKAGWKPTGIFNASDLAHFGDTIPAETFFCRHDIQKVAIPKTVTVLGKSAFYMCDGLVDVTFPPNLRNIQGEAFRNCESLKDVILPESVREIQEFAFAGTLFRCNTLTTLVTAVAPTITPITVHTTAFQFSVHFGPLRPGCIRRLHEHLKTISAQDNIVAALELNYKKYATLADLPPAVTTNHAKLQLHHYFWSIKTHHHHFMTSAQKKCVKAVLHISVRLLNTVIEHESKTVRRSSRRTEQRLMLPEMPPEMWICVLGMMRRTDLGAPAAAAIE